MKTKLLFITLVLISTNLFAQSSNKEFVLETNDFRVNIFTDNVRRTKPCVQFWDEWEYTTNESRLEEIKGMLQLAVKYNKNELIDLLKKFNSIRTGYILDCSTGMYRVFVTIYYTYDGQCIDRQENRTEEELQWHMPPPESVMEKICNYACKRFGCN